MPLRCVLSSRTHSPRYGVESPVGVERTCRRWLYARVMRNMLAGTYVCMYVDFYTLVVSTLISPGAPWERMIGSCLRQ